jgi:hypothetical protein
MDYLTAKNNKIFKSGTVVAFKNGPRLFDKWIEFWAGPYYHCGILYVDPVTGDISIYEASYSGIRRVEFGPGFLPFDAIDTGIDFNADVKAFADAQLGKSYSWLNFMLVMVRLNSSKFGFICSTLVGEILAKANDKFDERGMTPSQLVLDLVNKRCPIVSVS